MKVSETQKNIFSSVFLQITTIISGFVIPRIVLGFFGSDVNGMVSSVNQFLNYIQLVEGGLGGVVMAALYGPLREKDEKKIAGIINATALFFKKIGCVYVAYLILLSFAYPCFIDIGFNYLYSVILILVLGTNLIVQYFFSISYKILLNADKKVYIVSITQATIILVNVALVLLCSYFFKDILVIKLVSAIIFFAQPFVFSRYVNKHYRIDAFIPADKNALSQRWVAFGTNFAYFVHTNTDIIILTALSTLANVSVYSVYMLVINALKGLITAISSAIVPSFGSALASKDESILSNTFRKYEAIVHITSFLLFSCGAILIVPFVLIYTKGINDANYCQPVFAILMILAEFIYCIRDPYVQATSAAAMFRKIAPFAYIEAGINIVISVLLVRKYGIVGVAIGTICAMIFRMIIQVVIVGRSILHKRVGITFRRLFILSVSLLLSYYLFIFVYQYLPSINGVISWMIYAISIFVINTFIAIILFRLLYKDIFLYISERIKGRFWH